MRDINLLINLALNSLSERFSDRLKQLDITERAALGLMDIESRTLTGILTGTLTKLDFVSLLKLATFLDIDSTLCFQLYINEVHRNNNVSVDLVKRNKFIVENFDLPNLKKSKFISSIKNFDEIENRINNYFGLSSIYDYNKLSVTPAFKSTKKSKSQEQVTFWINSAIKQFTRIDNPNDFKKDELIELMPSFRDWTPEIGEGLLKVSKVLYKLGVTLIIQPSLAGLQASGATIPVNDKPCIVLSDFNKSFPMIWFALIHELFHVLFDWDEIRLSKYLLSIEGDTDEREMEADAFATDYLLPPNFQSILHKNYNDFNFIEQLAEKSKIHSSIILSVYGYNHRKGDTNFWIQLRKRYPQIIQFKKLLNINDWGNPVPALENASNIKNQMHTKD